MSKNLANFLKLSMFFVFGVSVNRRKLVDNEGVNTLMVIDDKYP